MHKNSFSIHPLIELTSVFICNLPLSQLRIQNDSRYPWFLIVPRTSVATELFELQPQEQTQLMREITVVSAFLKNVLQADRINVVSLGLVVPVIHVHVIGRYRSDFAWPKPVFGVGEAVLYTPDALQTLCARLQDYLKSSV